MFASRAAFRTARRAAQQLGGGGLPNDAVRGGAFAQHCFMTTARVRGAALANAAGVSRVGEGLDTLADGVMEPTMDVRALLTQMAGAAPPVCGTGPGRSLTAAGAQTPPAWRARRSLSCADAAT
eukprot:TRINITY_DN452_c1_g1_i4.p3 TRINITY_DN452_c1_g1~~TRINITY_DN452_c1_g1_i4.p3  ORF type:complete len:124 (+),score=8.45 TRINITY_DN452_c1_g1_i4:78-449(+)